MAVLRRLPVLIVAVLMLVAIGGRAVSAATPTRTAAPASRREREPGLPRLA